MIRVSVRSLLLGLFLAILCRSAAAQTGGAYESILRPGDVLRITVWPETSLSGEFPVEADGQAYLPFLGGVQATGVDVDDLRRRIREGFQAAQRNAVVTVTPLYRVGVTGAVRQPGLYLVPPTDGFFDLISSAGGFDIRANESDVKVVREGQVLRLNAKEALSTGETLPLDALNIRSGDQIIVSFDKLQWSVRDFIALSNLAISVVLLVDRLQN